MSFNELLCRTNFSFLTGASRALELAQRAKELGIGTIGVADDASLSGIVRAHQACKEAGVGLLVGARFRVEGLPEVALYVRSRQGYANLCRLITTGRRRAPKGQCLLVEADLQTFAGDLVCIAVAEVPAILSGRDRLTSGLARLREYFGDVIFLACRRFLGSQDERDLRLQVELASETGITPIASCDVLYHQRERQPLHDVMTCIRHGTTLDQAGYLLQANGERHLRSEAAIQALFRAFPELPNNTQQVVALCNFSLDELRYEYPDEVAPTGMSVVEYLHQETWAGASERYPAGVPDKVRALLEKELRLISELRYEPYFLTVYDIVTFARAQGILCQGRGSAANSAVCYCLGITSVDPAHHELLFERFISKERQEPPDIDVDFQNDRREEVLQYLYRKYGRERAGLVAVVITYRRRSSLREVAKVFGLSLDQADALSKHVDNLNDDVVVGRLREAGLDPDDRRIQLVVLLAKELKGFPRHLSQHVGGFVITRGRLDELVPVENAAMEDRTVIAWDKDDIDELGLLKIDCLALGMLSAIQKCFGMCREHFGIDFNLARVLATDSDEEHRQAAGLSAGAFPSQPVYDMICQADTVGVFQIESRAQMQMLPRLQPRTFFDLVIEVAIVRPGPIQGGMVHPYLRRRDGLEPVVYPHELCRPVLERTLGIPLFQEQVMGLAVAVAGYTPGEADQLRKDMAAWKRSGSLERHRDKLLRGMGERGIAPDFAERLFEQIKGFSDYGFPESHAASFALITYVSCFLKRYFPSAFSAALINAQPLGFYQNTTLVRDAREHGVEVRPPDINRSTYDCTLEEASQGLPSVDPATWGHGQPALRLGFRLVDGLSQEAADSVVAARKAGGPFCSVSDVARRTGLHRGYLQALAEADAFHSLGILRREAIWQVHARQKLPPLFRDLVEPMEAVTLPPMDRADRVIADYAAIGLSLRDHPMALIRQDLSARGVSECASLKDAASGQKVTVTGLVMCRQRPPTASGTSFITLEDETGVANIVVWGSVFERFRREVRLARVIEVMGKVERDSTGRVINLIADSIRDAGPSMDTGSRHPALKTTSRDFH